MKISYNWLNKYLDTKLSPENISEILTDTGLEVEGLEKIETVKGGLEGIVIGEVLTKSQHPNADKLSVTTVNVGEVNALNIVCGAPNVDVGQKVVVATVGTILYNGEDSFKIKKSKIRGEVSEGMICAEDEIGLGNSHDGIMVLESSAIVGTKAKEYFNVEDDYMLEIGLTPNRTDAMGHIGVARDLVAALNLKESAKLILPKTQELTVVKGKSIEVEIEDSELCPRYSGVTLSNIEVKDSPDWLKNSLLAIGLTPINSIVDVTNFVLHETGQPLHAFDADKIVGGKVVVKTLADKTKFVTLDEKERELSSNDLMICNQEGPMCIAGVFGGLDSGVTTNTKNIFLESAYFDAVSIRKTAKRHGLNTDASFRYERGADPSITIYALKRAINLMQELVGGEVSSEISDIYPEEMNKTIIEFSFTNCNKLIGEDLPKEQVLNILNGLEIEVLSEDGDKLQLNIPLYRADVKREIDVIEEVLRIYGYNNVSLPSNLSSALVYRQQPDKEKIMDSVSSFLVSNGFNEMLSNSLTKSSYYPNNDTLVKMSNPLSSELDVLRQSMLFNGLEVIQYNQNRKNEDLKLFELGKTYIKKGDKYKETNFLSIVLTGKEHKDSWYKEPKKSSLYHVKSTVDSLLSRYGLMEMYLSISETESFEFSYGLGYNINKNDIVKFGKVDVNIQKGFDISNDVYYVELNIDNFIKLVDQSSTIKYKEVSKYPAVKRDLALLIDGNIDYSSIVSIAQKQERQLLKKVDLFDVYEGKNLPEGKKSYGVSFLFQDSSKTLTDGKVDKIMNKFIVSFQSELGAELR